MNYLNAIDCLLLTLLGVQSLLALFVGYLPNQRYSHAVGVLGLLIVGIPHAGLVVLDTLKKNIKYGSIENNLF